MNTKTYDVPPITIRRYRINTPPAYVRGSYADHGWYYVCACDPCEDHGPFASWHTAYYLALEHLRYDAGHINERAIEAVAYYLKDQRLEDDYWLVAKLTIILQVLNGAEWPPSSSGPSLTAPLAS